MVVATIGSVDATVAPMSIATQNETLSSPQTRRPLTAIVSTMPRPRTTASERQLFSGYVLGRRNARVRDGEGPPRDFLQKLGLVVGDREIQQTQSRRAEDHTEDDASKRFGQISPFLERS